MNKKEIFLDLGKEKGSGMGSIVGLRILWKY